MLNDQFINRRLALVAFTTCALACANALASDSMQALSESEMADVEGQGGVGVVMEDFRFAHGHDEDGDRTFRLTGMTTEDGEDVEVLVDQLYVAGSESDYGQDLGTVNLGRLSNPFAMSLREGGEISDELSDKAVFEYAAPLQEGGYDCITGATGGDCSSRPADASDGFRGERPDIGLQTTVNAGSSEPQNVNFHAKSAVIDGSHIRFWGDDERNQLAGQVQMNFYTPELSINACDQSGEDCGDMIRFDEFMMELALGNEHQPLYFSVLGTGQEVTEGEEGNFKLEIPAISDVRSPEPINDSGDGSSDGDATHAFYEDYYTNDDYRSDIEVGELQIGDQSMGGARMNGVLFQKMDTTTRSLRQ